LELHPASKDLRVFFRSAIDQLAVAWELETGAVFPLFGYSYLVEYEGNGRVPFSFNQRPPCLSAPLTSSRAHRTPFFTPSPPWQVVSWCFWTLQPFYYFLTLPTFYDSKWAASGTRSECLEFLPSLPASTSCGASNSWLPPPFPSFFPDPPPCS